MGFPRIRDESYEASQLSINGPSSWVSTIWRISILKNQEVRITNMNQQGLTRSGNLDVGMVLTASNVGYPNTPEHLTKILQSFNDEQILICLSRINRRLQSIENPCTVEGCLKEKFCSPILQTQIDHKGLAERFVFNRQSTLHLLSESARLANPHSKRDMWQIDAGNDLARSYLIANELLESGGSAGQGGLETDLESELAERKRGVLIDTIPFLEYSTHPHPSRSTSELVVRSYELCRRFEEADLDIADLDIEGNVLKVNVLFRQATGLTFQEYYTLIFRVIRTFLFSSSPEAILDEGSLVVDLESHPSLTPLYERLLPHLCISIDELALKAKATSSLPKDFHLWRQYPLVKISDHQVICVDLSFLLDKLETGVVWIILNELEKRKKGSGQRIFALWGEVFADYAASILKRAIEAQIQSVEKCLIAPKYTGQKSDECTDIAIVGNDTLVLLECKASVLTAEAKFSGDFGKLHQELKRKVVEEKGIPQLWKAIQHLGHKDKKVRREVEGVDISKVKKIYPVLLLADHTFSAPCMNWFLDSEFQRVVNGNVLKKGLEIRPLTVLSIANLEQLEPWLTDMPFSVHLEDWLTRFKQDYRLGFDQYTYLLHEKTPRKNRYMAETFNQIEDEREKYLSTLGVDINGEKTI